MRYEIRQRAERQYVVFHNRTQKFTRGRFHSAAAAQQWIDQQRLDAVLKLIRGEIDGQFRGRARAHLITDCDYYRTNERNILTVTRLQSDKP